MRQTATGNSQSPPRSRTNRRRAPMTPKRRELATRSMLPGRKARKRSPQALPPSRGGDADAFRFADAATIATGSPLLRSIAPGKEPIQRPLRRGVLSHSSVEPCGRDGTDAESSRSTRHRRLQRRNACSSPLPNSGSPHATFEARRFNEMSLAMGATDAHKSSSWQPVNSLGLTAEA